MNQNQDRTQVFIWGEGKGDWNTSEIISYE